MKDKPLRPGLSTRRGGVDYVCYIANIVHTIWFETRSRTSISSKWPVDRGAAVAGYMYPPPFWPGSTRGAQTWTVVQ